MPKTVCITSIKDKEWDISSQRESVLRVLASKSRLSRSEVRDACAELGIKSALFYRLRRRYRSDERVSSLLPKKSGRIKGSLHLPAEIEAIIQSSIQEFYLTRQKPRISKLMREIASRAGRRGLKPPSRWSVEQRIKTRNLSEVLQKRHGSKVAREKTQPVIGNLTAVRPLQVVEIDHTKVDVFVVDEKHRQPIGRPWLTLLVDVCTRMVAGYYLSLDPPSSTSVALALQQAVLPKNEWLADRGISAPWPVSGLPEVLHMDNGKEFHSQALRRGAEEYGIRLVHRPVARPHYGGHIERLIGTMMGDVNLLSGTTFSNIDERGDYDPERHATKTLRELDQWFAINVVGRYHQTIHRALQRPPIAVWEEHAGTAGTALRQPKSAESFYRDFLPIVERKVTREGVSLFNIKYWDSVLSVWAGMTDRRFFVRYDPRDLSVIFLLSPEGNYLPIRCRDLSRPPITLWEHSLACKKLREQGRREVNEQIIFDAVEAQRMLAEEAAARTKSVRRHQQRTIDALVQRQPRRQANLIEAASVAEEQGGDIQPYEIEEWE